MKINPTFLEIVCLVFISLSIYIWVKYGRKIQRWWEEWHKQRCGPRQLKPKEPGDCPQCRRELYLLPKRPKNQVVPWSQRKSKRGRPQSIDTNGYACLNHKCDYFGIIDGTIHALVGDGKRGKDKSIQYLKCQCCGSRRTSRYGTPLYHLKTAEHRIAQVLTALAEGVDLSAAGRIFGHHPTTIGRWLVRMGQHSARFQERLFFQQVEAGHIQLDELVTKVKVKAEKLWIWTAVTAKSKLILALHIGGRSTDDGCYLIHQMSHRLKPGLLPVFTSDGLNQYFYALTAHFGYWDKPPRARKFHWFPDPRLHYAQLRKNRQGYRLKFLYSIIRLGTREVLRQLLKDLGLTGKVQTAYVERSNLTLRELIAPLSRRTWSLAYDVEHLNLHIQWGLLYYHLARPHQSLQRNIRGPSKYRYVTPTMAAGLAQRCWSVADLLHLPVPEQVWTDLALVL